MKFLPLLLLSLPAFSGQPESGTGFDVRCEMYAPQKAPEEGWYTAVPDNYPSLLVFEAQDIFGSGTILGRAYIERAGKAISVLSSFSSWSRPKGLSVAIVAGDYVADIRLTGMNGVLKILEDGEPLPEPVALLFECQIIERLGLPYITLE